MTPEAVIDQLKRLTKGKNGLSKAEMTDLLTTLRTKETGSLLQALYPERKAPAKKPKAETPAWIKDMQTAQKQLSWKMPEAVERLYLLASETGVEVSGNRKATLPAAAKHIAATLGEAKTRDIFVEWVTLYDKDHTMV